MEISLNVSAAHPCGYFNQLEATTMFLEPESHISSQMYQKLLELGFRRSGKIIYKPHCQNCKRCLSYRVVNHAFKPSRRHKRILKKNADLKMAINKPRLNDEHYDLYKYYLKQRHSDGGMDHHGRQAYFESIVATRVNTSFIELRLQQNLIAVAVTDLLDNGLSAVYTFFDPKLSMQRSLGSFVILKQIELAQSMNLHWLYLGYWIESCQKMAYKSGYQPAQVLIDGKWHKNEKPHHRDYYNNSSMRLK